MKVCLWSHIDVGFFDYLFWGYSRSWKRGCPHVYYETGREIYDSHENCVSILFYQRNIATVGRKL